MGERSRYKSPLHLAVPGGMRLFFSASSSSLKFKRSTPRFALFVCIKGAASKLTIPHRVKLGEIVYSHKILYAYFEINIFE